MWFDKLLIISLWYADVSCDLVKPLWMHGEAWRMKYFIQKYNGFSNLSWATLIFDVFNS